MTSSSKTREQARVDRTLNDVRIVWPSPASCVKALELYRLTYLSVGMGFVDSLIAQTAIELQLPLHTINVKHFQHVHELVTVQPYTR